MGRIKQLLTDAECNGHIHPAMSQALSAFQPSPAQPQPQPQTIADQLPDTVFGVFRNGSLISVCLYKDTADYDCWLSRMGEELNRDEVLGNWYVMPIPFNTHDTRN